MAEDTPKAAVEQVAAQNRRKLQAHLRKLSGDDTEDLIAEERKREEARRFRRDWARWKQIYGQHLLQAESPPPGPKSDYALLGLTSKVTRMEVRRAFHALAKIHHPDAGGKLEQFRELMAAYERLTQRG